MQLLPLLAIPIGLALPLNICHQTPCKYQDAKEFGISLPDSSHTQ